MDFDSKGNLYFATGDNTGNTPNSNNGGYTNSSPNYTVPCPGTRQRYVARAAATSHARTTVAGRALRPRSPTPTRARPRATRTPSRASCCGSSRWTTRATVPGIGTTYTIPGADAPERRRNLFAPDSQAVKDGKAKPEVFAMGVAQPVLDRHRLQDGQDLRPRGSAPTRAPKLDHVGPGEDRERHAIKARPATTAGRTARPATGSTTAPSFRATTGGGTAANLSDNVRGTVGGGADGQTGAFWDCQSQAGRQRLAVQHGPDGHPGPEAGQHLVRPAGRLLRLPAQRQRRRRSTTPQQHRGQRRARVPSLPVRVRRQPGADDGRHLPQAGRHRSRTPGRPTGTAAGSCRTSRAATTSVTRC